MHPFFHAVRRYSTRLREPFNPAFVFAFVSHTAGRVKSILGNKVLLISFLCLAPWCNAPTCLLYCQMISIVTIISQTTIIIIIIIIVLTAISDTVSAHHLRADQLIFTWRETDGGRPSLNDCMIARRWGETSLLKHLHESPRLKLIWRELNMGQSPTENKMSLWYVIPFTFSSRKKTTTQIQMIKYHLPARAACK